MRKVEGTKSRDRELLIGSFDKWEVKLWRHSHRLKLQYLRMEKAPGGQRGALYIWIKGYPRAVP